MHIADGAVTRPVWIGGAILAAGGIGLGLRKMTDDDVPRVAVLASAFFVASLIHVPVGYSSAHLLLCGLTGLILGWEAFPALFVALLLQYVFFGFGGLTTLGVNILDMALPAVLCGALFAGPIRRAKARGAAVAFGFLAGALGVFFAGILTALALCLSGKAFRSAAALLLLAHVPIMIAEGLVTAAAAVFLRRVRPEMLRGAGGRRRSPVEAGIPGPGRNACGEPAAPALAASARRRPSSGAVSLLALGLFLFGAWNARAHKVHIFAAGNGDAISGYAYFSGGERARNCPIRVYDSSGRKVTEVRTNARGEFRIPVHFRCAYRLNLDTGDGHTAHATVPADELDPALPSPAGAAKSAPARSTARSAKSSADSANAAPPLPAPDTARDLSRILDRVIARRLYPIEERLDRYQEKVWLHDILGGIGWIVGCAGAWVLLRNRVRS